MKKIMLALGIVLASFSSNAQTAKEPKFSYRVGVMSSLPVDIYGDDYRIGLGACLLEASYRNEKVSKKFSFTGNAGYIRMTSKVAAEFAQIPVMVGARYPINKSFYFGGSAGVTFYNKKEFVSQDFIYSPYFGYQSKHLSADLRYLNTLKDVGSMKTVGLVFSYTL